MIDKSFKLKSLEKILQNHDFDAKSYQDLLSYLVNHEIKGEHVKEIGIAIDVFGRDSNFNPPEDPIVRVYMSNLRKKLEHYYLTDGKEDRIRLVIPKGHYDVKFERQENNNKKKKIKKPHFYYLIFIPVIISLILIIVFLLYNRRNISNIPLKIAEDNLIWAEYITGNYPNLIVLGDYFFYYEQLVNENRRQFIRDPHINSSKEFDEFLIRRYNGNKNINKLEFTYLRPSATWSMVELLPILWASPQKSYLKLGSELDWGDLENRNMIFVGSFKCLYILNQLLSNTHFRYEITTPRIFLLDDNGDTVKTYDTVWRDQGNYQKDYAIIAKIPQSNNTTLMLIMGFDEVSISEATKLITNPTILAKLESEFNQEKFEAPLFFELLVEVEGIERTSFRSEIIHFRKINPDEIINKNRSNE